MTLVFDTETTGKADFKKAAIDPCQPKMVQLGAILYDPEWFPRLELNLLVKPDGYEIPEQASKIHGITTEVATKYGWDLADVLCAFNRLVARCGLVAAHNFDYDQLVLNNAWHRAKGQFEWPKWRCTMKEMTPICKLPGYYGPKWPSLQEAHKFCFQQEFEGAHDAMADVRACGRILRWLMEREAKHE